MSIKMLGLVAVVLLWAGAGGVPLDEAVTESWPQPFLPQLRVNAAPTAWYWAEGVSVLYGVLANTTVAFRTGLKAVCDKIGGFTDSSGELLCAVKGTYSQLTAMLPGDPPKSIEEVCNQLEGTVFGTAMEFCVVKGHVSQLTSRLTGTPISTNMSAVCRGKLNGTSFGTHGEFCAVRGVVSQLTARLPMEKTSSRSYDITKKACKNLEGVSFGVFDEHCAVSGRVTQVNNRLPGDSQWSWSSDSSKKCAEFSDHGASCAVKGPVSVASSRLPGDSRWSNIDCPFSNAFVFSSGSSQCLSTDGASTQLHNKLPGMYQWQNSPPAPCRTIDGARSYGRSCSVPGRYVQITTQLPWLSSPPTLTKLCEGLGGTLFMDQRSCVVEGESTYPSPESSPSDGSTSLRPVMVVVSVLATLSSLFL